MMPMVIDSGTFFLGFVVGVFFALGGLWIVNIVLKLIGKKPIILHIQAHDEKLLESIESFKRSATGSHDLTPILEALQELKSKQELESQALESLKKDLEKQQQTLHNLSQSLESIKDQIKPFEPPLPTQRW
ncbi:hypothetical protein [Helicobacter canis]|uniref:Uncharacterized protein n=1 Tax=Helicobacter canis TaxID=29419 RepID=A0A377J1D7_9HELI|nr:hypothetical protein [Helicobacter canis]STO96222.1 Uncharacterised protein [Helicobacter canis]STO96287.1 Uncharacterised protein [Helicobacter canis]